MNEYLYDLLLKHSSLPSLRRNQEVKHEVQMHWKNFSSTLTKRNLSDNATLAAILSGLIGSKKPITLLSEPYNIVEDPIAKYWYLSRSEG